MNWFIGLFIAAIIGSLGVAGYFYFDYSQKQIERISTDLGTLKVVNEAQDQTIRAVQEANKLMLVIAEKVQEQQTLAANAVTDLERKFNKMTIDGQRDIGRLAEARPDSIERIINNATNVVFRCMEISTGKDLNQQEREEYDATGKIAACPGTVLPR